MQLRNIQEKDREKMIVCRSPTTVKLYGNCRKYIPQIDREMMRQAICYNLTNIIYFLLLF